MRPFPFIAFLALISATIGAPAPAAERPSADPGAYVVIAGDLLQTRGITVVEGDLAANAGIMLIRRDIFAANSSVAANRVQFVGGFDSCTVGQLFANEGVEIGNPCGTPTAFQTPVLGPGSSDLRRACQFPNVAFPCDRNAPALIVLPGDNVSLPPGEYGDVFVKGSAEGFTTLTLRGGDYSFCSLRTTRNTRLFFDAPATVKIAGDVRIGDRSFTGPSPAARGAPRDFRFFTIGDDISIRQRAELHATFCAPAGRAHIGPRVLLEGQMVAKQVRIDGNVIMGLSGSLSTPTTTVSTTTTTTTTTTTVPHVCGNGVRESVEACDGRDFGSATCPGGSATGALVCRDACTRIDSSGCPPTTTSTSSTTSTTLPPPVCGNGVKERGEMCDAPDFGGASCPGGGTGLRCNAGCGSIDTSACTSPPVEQCGNCLDDDGNGLTDFEDPACCTEAPFRMTLSRGVIVPGGQSSRVRLRAVLARAGLASIDPRVQDVYVQLRGMQDGREILCAHVPAFRFLAKRRVFRFRDKAATVASARGITALALRIKSDGSVRFRARGKQVSVTDPAAGRVQVTVALHKQGTAADQNRCSTTEQAFRTTPKGRLRTP